MKPKLYFSRYLTVVAGVTLLLPIAITAVAIAFALMTAMVWMSAVHAMLTRCGGGESLERFPVAERSDVTVETPL